MSPRIGIIGCGRILNAHLRGLKLLQDRGLADFTITALCSRNIQDARMFRSPEDGVAPREPVTDAPADGLSARHQYVSELQAESPAIYDDYRQVVADENVDAAIVLTALDSHHDICVALAEAGKHVFVEKPLAITVAAGRRMVQAADRAGVVLATAEVARFKADCRARHWAIEAGRIGDVQMVLSGMMGHPDWSPDHIVGDTPWRHHKLRGGGGPTIDLGVHRLNQIEYECGPIEAISAVAATTEQVRRYRPDAPFAGTIESDAEDTAFATLRFVSGAVGTLLFTWGGRGRLVEVPAFAISGSTGGIFETELTDGNGARADVIATMRADAAPESLEAWFPGGIDDAFALEALDWFAAIESGAPAEVDGQAGLRDLAAALAILESDIAHREVTIESVLNGEVDAYQRPIDRELGIRPG